MSAESPSFHQITEQHDRGKHATVLTKRASGEIQTATYSGDKDEQGRYFVELNEKDESGNNKYRAMTTDNLSDDGQARLAEELASSRVTGSELGEHEHSEEISEETREAIEQFLSKSDAQLVDFNERTIHQLGVVADVKGALDNVRYYAGDKHSLQGALSQLQELQTVLMHEQATFDDEFQPLVRQLQENVEEAVSDARRVESETLRSKLRKVSGAAEEIGANTRILSSINEDSLSEVTALVTVMDDYLRESWGEETYQSSLGQRLDALDDLLHNRRARGSALRETLPELGTAIG